MSNQSQELLMRPKPVEPERIQPEQEQKQADIEFDQNGGGGGPPKAFFKSYSSVSSYTCRPDPDNPGKQICTRTESQDSFDPFKGHSSRKTSSEEQKDTGLFGRLFGTNDNSYDRQPDLSQAAQDDVNQQWSQGGVRPQHFGQKLLDFFNFNEDQSNFGQDRSQDFDQRAGNQNYQMDQNDFRRQQQHPFMGGRHQPPGMINPFQMMEQMEREFFGGGDDQDDFFDDIFQRGSPGQRSQNGNFAQSPFDDFERMFNGRQEMNDPRFQNGGGNDPFGFSRGASFPPPQQEERFSRRSRPNFSNAPAQQQRPVPSQNESNFRQNHPQNDRSNFINRQQQQQNRPQPAQKIRFKGEIYDV